MVAECRIHGINTQKCKKMPGLIKGSSIGKNTYRAPIRLFITGSGEIASTEGTTQGDPLAIAMYALAITP